MLELDHQDGVVPSEIIAAGDITGTFSPDSNSYQVSMAETKSIYGGPVSSEEDDDNPIIATDSNLSHFFFK